MKPLYKYPQTKMNDEIGLFLLKITLMENSRQDFPEEEAGSMFQLIKKRLDYHGIPHSKHLVLFLCLIPMTPGSAVLFSHAIACMYQKLEREVTLSDFCVFFPDGLPSDDTLIKAWDAQKVEGTNIVDYVDTWTPEALKAVA